MAGRGARLRNDNIIEEDESFYNIYTLSFHNIMGSASDVVRGRFMVRLKRLEERARDLMEEYRILGFDRLTMIRRSFEQFSSVSWRIKSESGKRRMVTLDDEEVREYLGSLSDIEKEQIHSFDRELQLLNANLKIEWTKYLEICRLSQAPTDEMIYPKLMPSLIES